LKNSQKFENTDLVTDPKSGVSVFKTDEMPELEAT